MQVKYPELGGRGLTDSADGSQPAERQNIQVTYREIPAHMDAQDNKTLDEKASYKSPAELPVLDEKASYKPPAENPVTPNALNTGKLQQPILCGFSLVRRIWLHSTQVCSRLQFHPLQPQKAWSLDLQHIASSAEDIP